MLQEVPRLRGTLPSPRGTNATPELRDTDPGLRHRPSQGQGFGGERFGCVTASALQQFTPVLHTFSKRFYITWLQTSKQKPSGLPPGITPRLASAVPQPRCRPHDGGATDPGAGASSGCAAPAAKGGPGPGSAAGLLQQRGRSPGRSRVSRSEGADQHLLVPRRGRGSALPLGQLARLLRALGPAGAHAWPQPRCHPLSRRAPLALRPEGALGCKKTFKTERQFM